MILKEKIDKRLLAKPLLKSKLDRFVGCRVKYYKREIYGQIESELEQIGTNFRVVVRWDKTQMLTGEWLTCLIPQDRKLCFKAWRNKLINGR